MECKFKANTNQKYPNVLIDFKGFQWMFELKNALLTLPVWSWGILGILSTQVMYPVVGRWSGWRVPVIPTASLECFRVPVPTPSHPRCPSSSTLVLHTQSTNLSSASPLFESSPIIINRSRYYGFYSSLLIIVFLICSHLNSVLLIKRSMLESRLCLFTTFQCSF